jgi:YD repeat-containing protein
MEERFTYDMLDRLTGVVEGLDTTGVFAYDTYGRMTSKYLQGEMVFDSTAYWASGRLQRIQMGNTSLSLIIQIMQFLILILFH